MFRLTHEQRLLVLRFLPRHPHGPGRPWLDSLAVLDVILHVMRTGISWRALGITSPSRRTCKRRYDEWLASGALRQILLALAEDLEYRAGIDPFAPVLKVPDDPRRRASWVWQTVLLLRSQDSRRILATEPAWAFTSGR